MSAKQVTSIQLEGQENVKVRSTLKDVASVAGVSQTTVSLYLNGFSQVCSDETAGRIRQAVTQLQYTRGLKALHTLDMSLPQAQDARLSDFGFPGKKAKTPQEQDLATAIHARPLSGRVLDMEDAPRSTGRQPFANRPSLGIARRLRTIGVALPTGSSSTEETELGHPAMQRFTDRIWTGASEVAEWEEFRLLSFPKRLQNRESGEVFIDGTIGGLILEAGYHDPRVEALTQYGLPVVLINRFLDIPPGCGAVYPMERDTAEITLNYLWERGHRRIAHYGGPIALNNAEMPPQSTGEGISWLPSDFATARFERYQAFMRRHQVTNPQFIFSEDTWDGTHAAQVLMHWRSLPQPPTAVFCANDSLAIALWKAAEEMGLSIPNDLSIIGVGDSSEAYRAGRPLSTIALPGLEIGREAVQLLLRMIEGVSAHTCRQAIPMCETALIERDSVRQVKVD